MAQALAASLTPGSVKDLTSTHYNRVLESSTSSIFLNLCISSQMCTFALCIYVHYRHTTHVHMYTHIYEGIKKMRKLIKQASHWDIYF